MSDQPTPTSVEKIAHLLKIACSLEQIAELQDGLDQFLAVLEGIEVPIISGSAVIQLSRIAAALHVITAEPTVRFEDAEYINVTPPTPPPPHPPLYLNNPQDDPYRLRPSDDDLNWLDRFLPTDV